MKQTKQSVGYAGEHAVAYELCRRGFLCALTPHNAQHVDILAAKDGKQKMVQCKCCQYGKADWMVKPNGYVHEDCFYVFVILKGLDERPEFYIVPSKVVAEYASSHHAEWLATPGRGGRAHQDTDMRRFKDITGEWKERWDLLENG